MSDTSKRFALKLAVHQIQEVQVQRSDQKAFFSYQGLPAERVWLQGNIQAIQAGTFFLSDAAGKVKVVAKHLQAELAVLKEGDYVLVIGAVKVGPNNQIWIRGHKVTLLSDGPQRSELWQQELAFLQSLVYPALAST